MANTENQLHKPFELQRDISSNITICFFIKTDCPMRFPTAAHYHIKGLNAEAIIQVPLPIPIWLTSPEYEVLRLYKQLETLIVCFSLNLSIYNQAIRDDEWTEVDIGQIINFTIPTIIVRDASVQLILLRNFLAFDDFPIFQLVVYFRGIIVDIGSALLKKEDLLWKDDSQFKCCGFVNLSTYLMPGTPSKPPYGGFHAF
ncbi:hypothetical protein EDB80DRAFT_748189 [Ilyonectria destructans]|nr:hypothetical protein EDB80DRAFT_748189 [Ilyonectria destructans]